MFRKKPKKKERHQGKARGKYRERETYPSAQKNRWARNAPASRSGGSPKRGQGDLRTVIVKDAGAGQRTRKAGDSTMMRLTETRTKGSGVGVARIAGRCALDWSISGLGKKTVASTERHQLEPGSWESGLAMGGGAPRTGRACKEEEEPSRIESGGPDLRGVGNLEKIREALKR